MAEIQQPQKHIEKLGESLSLKLEASQSKNPWISFVPVISTTNETVDNGRTEESEDVYVKPKAFVDKDEIEAGNNRIVEEDSDTDDDDDDIVINKPIQVKSDENKDSENELKNNASKEIDSTNILIIDEDNEINEAEDEINTKSSKKFKNKRSDTHILTLSEAFADDDVIAEFRQEKVCSKNFRNSLFF